jgi:pilus assembly protein FimV
MNRSLKLSMLLALALGSTQAAALELGQIQVKSALGQPLLAEIPVNPDSPAELQNLTARLASAEDAAQAGVAAGPTIPLQFSVVDGANGKKVIRITSAAPVNDPYLDLLVEVNNAAGRSLREFTILLDPPNSVASAPATAAPTQAAPKSSRHATAPAAASSSEVTAAAPAPAPEAKPAKPKPAPAPRAAGGSTFPVERGQTLSGIAHETAPDGVDVNQMLLALKQANPDAFYRDNINALKSGVVLRVPTREDAQATAAAAAAAEVRRQNSDWRTGAVRTATTVADAGTRANASSAPTTAAPGGDHLALVPAKEGSDNAAGKGGKGDKAEKGMAALHQDLLRSQESLASLQQQGDELKSRLKDLEGINGKNERLLSLKDNEIADLQKKLADARKAKGVPAEAAAKPAAATSVPAKPEAAKVADEAVVKASAPATAPASASTSGPATPVAASSTVAPAHASNAAQTQAKPAVQPAAKPAPVAEEEPWYMQTWAWGVGAGAAVLLLLVGLRGRGRKPAAAATAAGTSSLADRFGTVPPGGPASADPDQDELLDQLAEHPDDIGLHLELVSLYYSRRDVDHFEAAAEAMHAHIADSQQPEWQDVVHMGEDLVPEHPLFAHAAQRAPQGGAEHDALDHFDLGRYANDHEEDDLPPPIPSATGQQPHHPKVSEYHFDFDLTPRQTNLHAHAPASSSATAVENEVAEEFDAHATSWEFAEPSADPVSEASAPHHELHHDLGQLNDDPVDTKLDLARAYLDMGDPDGAHAMLEEVMHEGTQMQKDVAKRLLDSIR